MPKQYGTSVQMHIEAHSGFFRQRGISLAMVLISLVVMSLAAVGLVRMTDSGAMIVGNVAFKQAATAATDRGMELAMTWLVNNGTTATVESDSTNDGYYASVRPELDLVGTSSDPNRVLIDWQNNQCQGSGVPANRCLSTASIPAAESDAIAHAVRYVIIRQCEGAGSHAAWTLLCARPQVEVSADAGTREAPSYESPGAPSEAVPPEVYYRVIVRSAGARNTVSFTEAYVNF